MLSLWNVLPLQILLFIVLCHGTNWEEWWTYSGISGPTYWGRINPEWFMCKDGRHQSPINVEPSNLLYDSQLRYLHVDKHKVNGNITNTGHGIIFRVDNETKHHINISGGPLSYQYRFHEIHIHYGSDDTKGSEHTIDGKTFPAEIQILGYNSHLYHNMTDAMKQPQGLVGIALLVQHGDLSNPELRLLTSRLDSIKFQAQQATIKSISIRELMPDTDFYITYEGSITMPGCYETVSWIIMNKPIYITRQQLHALRKLTKGILNSPTGLLENNFRPHMPLNHRPVRTNIDFKYKQGKQCPTMDREMHYKANT